MKLDAASLKKLFRNKDTWVVVGGAAAAVTAIAVVTGRGGSGSRSDSAYAYPSDGVPAGAGGDTADPSKSTQSGQDHFSDFPVWDVPQPVARPAAKSVPVVALPSSPAFVDAAGNPATIDQIMAQRFPVAAAPMTSSPSTTAAIAPASSVVQPTPVDSTTYFADRWGNRVTLDELLAQGPLTNRDARTAPAPTAPVSSPPYAFPEQLYVEPIVARNAKTPGGGGLGYPAEPGETFMGGGGTPLVDHSSAALAA